MSLLIGFLTFILVVNCVFLVLLVLIQLPKKEAGAGLAFGGGATDALFGAGSGNALTKMTKYAAATFLGLSLVLTILNTQRAGSSIREVEAELARRATTSSVPSQIQQVVPTTPTNQGLRNISLTNSVVTPASTNAAAAPTQAPANTPSQPANPASLPAQPAGQQP